MAARARRGEGPSERARRSDFHDDAPPRTIAHRGVRMRARVGNGAERRDFVGVRKVRDGHVLRLPQEKREFQIL